MTGDVGADGNRFGAELRRGADNLLQLGFVASGQRQLGAFASIGQGDGPPNASSRARNDCYLTIQFHGVTSPGVPIAIVLDLMRTHFAL